MRWRLASLCLLLAACGESRATVAPEPAPPPSSVTTSAPPTTTTETPPTAPEPPPAAPPIALSASATRAQVRRIRVPYGLSPTANARLDALEESARAAFAIEARAAAAHHVASAERPMCQPWVRTPAFASSLCATTWEDDGRDAYPTGLVRIYPFEIVGDDVRPTTIEAAFVDQAALDASIALGLTRACDYVREQHVGDEYGSCPDGWTLEYASLGATSLELRWRVAGSSDWGGRVPYWDILDRLRADGPVARILQLGAFAPSAPAPIAAPAPGDPAGPWALTSPVPSVEAAARWAALAPEMRADVVLFTTSTPGLVQLGAETQLGIARARELAATLGGTVTSASEGSEERIFELRRASHSVNVRVQGEGSASWVRALPRGAIAVAMIDPSVPETPWTHVIAGASDGWASSRYLDPERCYPDASSAVASVPRTSRDAARRELLRVRAGVQEHGRLVPAMLVVWHEDVSLHRYDEETCTLGARIGAWTTDDPIVDALVTRTAEHDGEPLVMVQTAPQHGSVWDAAFDMHTGTSWVAFRVGSAPRASAWSLAGFAHPSLANEVVAPATRGPSGRGFWPLAIVRRGQPIVPYRWTGTTLEADVPEVAPAPEPTP